MMLLALRWTVCKTVVTMLALASLVCAGRAWAQTSGSLYAQSVAQALARTHPHLDLLVMDVRSGGILASTFARSAQPVPVGSMVKPFLATAYLGAGGTARPLRVVCRGHADRCWTAHGSPDLVEALAGSCNAYFLAMAARLLASGTRIPYLPAPPDDAAPEDLVGLSARWRIAPADLAQAFAELVRSSDTPAAVLAGMRGSASYGTAARLGRHPGGVLAKTGTAPCVAARCLASGEGWVVAAEPGRDPQVLLLAHQAGTTGSATAAVAGSVLAELERMHAFAAR